MKDYIVKILLNYLYYHFKNLLGKKLNYDWRLNMVRFDEGKNIKKYKKRLEYV